MAVSGCKLLPWAAEMLLWAAAWLLWTAEPHRLANKWLLWSERRLLWAAKVVLDNSIEALDSQIELWLQRGSIFQNAPKFATQRKPARPERKLYKGEQKSNLNLRTYD